MLIVLFFIILAIACYKGLASNSQVAFFVLLIGFTQDPVRKLIAGEPIFMTIMVGLVIACIAMRCILDSQRSVFEPFVEWSSNITLPWFVISRWC